MTAAQLKKANEELQNLMNKMDYKDFKNLAWPAIHANEEQMKKEDEEIEERIRQQRIQKQAEELLSFHKKVFNNRFSMTKTELKKANEEIENLVRKMDYKDFVNLAYPSILARKEQMKKEEERIRQQRIQELEGQRKTYDQQRTVS